MRKSPLALLLSLICLISSHNEIQAQGHPPTDSLRQRAAASVGKEKHDLGSAGEWSLCWIVRGQIVFLRLLRGF